MCMVEHMHIHNIVNHQSYNWIPQFNMANQLSVTSVIHGIT